MSVQLQFVKSEQYNYKILSISLVLFMFKNQVIQAVNKLHPAKGAGDTFFS